MCTIRLIYVVLLPSTKPVPEQTLGVVAVGLSGVSPPVTHGAWLFLADFSRSAWWSPGPPMLLRWQYFVFSCG